MKLFVWDFHGVLEKGNERAVLEISNKVLENFGYRKRFTEEDNLRLYGVRWYQYFEDLLPNESHKKHFELQQACISYEDENPQIISKHIKANDYAYEVLEAIGSLHRQILISNVSAIAFNRFMDAIDVRKYFSNGNAFATNSHLHLPKTTKKDKLRNFLRGNSFEDIIIVGDTAADMEMSQVAGGKTYLYAHPGRKHHDVPSTYKIHDLRDVLREL